MADQKASGLLIAVIVFVVLSAILAVTSFCFYQRSARLQTALARAQEQRKEAETRTRDALDKIKKLTEIIGYPQYDATQIGTPDDAPDEQGATLLARIKFDLQKYADPSDRSYQAVERMNLLVAELAEQLDTINAVYAALEREYNLKRTVESQRLTIAQNFYEQAGEDLQTVQQQAEQKLKEQLDAYEKLRQIAAQAKNRETQRQRELENYLGRTDREINILTQQIRESKEELSTWEVVAEPVGMVVNIEHAKSFARSKQRMVVSAATTEGYVYINIGEAEGVRLRTTFSVWGPDEIATPYWQERNKMVEEQAEQLYEQTRKYITPHKQSGPKAAIEVVEIIGPHLSKARIIDSRLDNPISPGDKIYSPIFMPGRKVRIALLGRFDLDGESGDDRDLFKAIIEAQGGIVEVITDDEGEIKVVDESDPDRGNKYITAHTDWLILGEIPKNVASPDEKESQYALKILESSNVLQSQAKRLGVKIIDQKQFLSFMGLGSQDYTYELGGYAGGPYPGRRFENPAHTTQPQPIGSRRIRERPEEVIYSVTKPQAD